MCSIGHIAVLMTARFTAGRLTAMMKTTKTA